MSHLRERAEENNQAEHVPLKNRPIASYEAKIERLRAELEHARGQAEHFKRENIRLQNKIIRSGNYLYAFKRNLVLGMFNDGNLIEAYAQKIIDFADAQACQEVGI